MRELTYWQALNETFFQILNRDEKVFMIGQGVNSPWYVGRTTEGLCERFGEERIIDTPVSECSITGSAVGAALAGMRPIVIHPRMDFMYYAFDPIINHAAMWYFMFGSNKSVPLTIWAIINRGGEQSAQHSQSLQAIFAHVPGLKVVMPSTPFDAKGLLVSAVKDDNPVLFIDDRWLYEEKGEVPEELYSIPIGKGIVRKKGADVTIVANSYVVKKAIEAAEILTRDAIQAEVIDLRSIKPLDKNLIFESVKKTGKLVVVDAGWKTCGLAAEISALIAEGVFSFLKSPIIRVTLPDAHAPASIALEQEYYIKSIDIVSAVKRAVK
jgi:pyruvate dehydrogenase E1 component beta subunit